MLAIVGIGDIADIDHWPTSSRPLNKKPTRANRRRGHSFDPINMRRYARPLTCCLAGVIIFETAL